MIAFIGSVFSPYYFQARSNTSGPPAQNHCAVNVALYGGRRRRWTMTERGSADFKANQNELAIGSSLLEVDASKLVLSIDERTPMLGRRVCGSILVEAQLLTGFEAVLDERMRHFWYPLAPRVHVEVDFAQPSLRWSGTGYLDMNRGNEPLEEAFAHWNWSRASIKKEAAILYDLYRHRGAPLSLSLRIGAGGDVEAEELPATRHLPRTLIWRMPRSTRSDPNERPRVVRTLEDTPFYSRSMISTRLFGERATAMHESLSLDRFQTKIVQAMLPYRMPRVAGGEV